MHYEQELDVAALVYLLSRNENSKGRDLRRGVDLICVSLSLSLSFQPLKLPPRKRRALFRVYDARDDECIYSARGETIFRRRVALSKGLYHTLHVNIYFWAALHARVHIFLFFVYDVTLSRQKYEYMLCSSLCSLLAARDFSRFIIENTRTIKIYLASL